MERKRRGCWSYPAGWKQERIQPRASPALIARLFAKQANRSRASHIDRKIALVADRLVAVAGNNGKITRCLIVKFAGGHFQAYQDFGFAKQNFVTVLQHM